MMDINKIEVTARAIQQIKLGKHDLKLEAAMLQERAVMELDYSRNLRSWAKSVRNHIEQEDILDVNVVRKAFWLLADEADAESNKHHKVCNDVWMNSNGPYKKILSFREMNYHKDDNGRGCREVNFYEEEFKKLALTYKEAYDKFQNWKYRFSQVKIPTQGSRPWFLQPSHKVRERQIKYAAKKYHQHTHREREERKAFLQNSTKLLNEMRSQEMKRLTMLVNQFRAYLRILRQNHEESFTRRECLNNIETHLDNIKLDEVLEDWSGKLKEELDDARHVKYHGDGDDRSGFKELGDDHTDYSGMSKHKLVDDDSEQDSSNAETDSEESCNGRPKEGIPLAESREDTELNVEKVLPKDAQVEMFQISDADELDEVELECPKKYNRTLSKQCEDLITQSSSLGLQNLGYATETEEEEVINLGPEKRDEARTTAWVMRQTTASAWSHADVDVRETKSSAEHRRHNSDHGRKKNAAACSEQEMRKQTSRVNGTFATLGMGTNIEQTAIPLPSRNLLRQTSSSSYTAPKAVVSVDDYKAKTPTELSFNRGRALKVLVGENEEGMVYGYKITNIGKKKMGFFPASLVEFSHT